MAQIKQLIDQNNTRFYPVTHAKAVIGLKEVEFAVKVSEEELLTLINTSSLEPGQCYYISGFTTKINEDNPVISQQHKIDLYLSALGKSQISNKAYAAYNTDGTDNYYKDLNVPVDKWNIEVSFTGNDLNVIKDIKIKIDSSLDIHTGYNTTIAHNGVDTLIVACNKSNVVSISKDSGKTFYKKELPHTYTDIQGLIYGIGKFILFDSDGFISVSSDNGESWQLISNYQYTTITSSYSINSLLSGYTSACVSENEFFIVGNHIGIRSTDGINWTTFKHDAADNGWFKPQVAAGNGKILVSSWRSYAGHMMWSGDNGVTWNKIQPYETYWSGVCFGNNSFAAVAGNRHSAVILNADQVTTPVFTEENSSYNEPNLAKDPGKVCFNNGVFYSFDFAREATSYAYSENGINWNSVSFPEAIFVNGYGQSTPTFGANGEMYLINSLDRSIWRNPIPKQGDTWEQLTVPTEIHFYDSISSNGINYLLIPQEKEFCILHDDTVGYTRFKNSMTCEAVVYTGDQYQGIFLNSENSSYNIALSENGIDWQYFEFSEPGSSKCKAFTLNSNTKDILCIFDTGTKYIINRDQYKLLEQGSSNLSDVKCVYNQFLNKFVVIEQIQNTNSIQAQFINTTFDEFSKEVYSLPSQMYVTDLNTSYYNIYLSGYNLSNNEEYYTYKISTRNFQSELLSLNGYIISSIKSDVGIFATTNNYTSYVIQNSNCLDLDIQIEKLYLSNGNSILAKIVDIQEIVKINYTPYHNLTISKLTDEYNNTCNFDFRNLCKVNVNSTTNYFFNTDGLDASTTGFVKNFTQVNGNDSLIKYTMFDIYYPLYNCTVTENTKGIFTIDSLVSNLHFKNVTTCYFKTLPLNLSTTKAKELWKINRTIYLKEDCGDELYYTENNGIIWNVKNSNVSLEGYATEDFVTSQGYLTKVPDNVITEETLQQKNYITQTQIQDYVNESLADYITADDLNDQGFLTEVPSEYVTDGELEEMGYATEYWVQDKGYLTEHQDISNLATKEEIPSLEGYALKDWTHQSFAKKYHEYVDLGLPSGVLWATTNIGAENPEDSGQYFSWGELETKETYRESNYKWFDSEGNLTKYNIDSSIGTVDNKTQLEPEDDVANLMWSNGWRIPTDEEQTELLQHCNWELVTQNDVKGYKVSSTVNDNYIFLPMVGYKAFESLDSYNTHGYYQSSVIIQTEKSKMFNGLSLSTNNKEFTGLFRWYGSVIRPVISAADIQKLDIAIQDISKLKTSIGFSDDITITFTGTNNLDECKTLIEAILKLDSLITTQTT